MLPKFKAVLTATMLSSVALVPAATVGVFVSADMAFAKSDNAGGKGNGAGRGNSAKGGGNKSASAGGKGNGKGGWKNNGNGASANGKGKWKNKGGDSVASRGKGNGNLGMKGFREDMKQAGDEIRGLFRKATGQKPVKSRTAKSGGAKYVSQTVETIDGDTRPAVRTRPGKKGLLHPSVRGNMNGALNANENAIAAHLRNGNRNGPVGLMAGYVEARAITDAAIEHLGPEAEEYIDLNKALGDQTLEEYLASGEPNEEVDDILTRIEWSDQERLLDEAGIYDPETGEPSFEEYQRLVADEEIEPITEIEEASDELNEFDDDVYADVEDKSDELNAAHDAEDDLIAYWNKNDRSTEEEEELLREELDHRAMQVEETAVVEDSLPEFEHEDKDDDDDVVENPCDDGADACTTDDEEVAQLPQ